MPVFLLFFLLCNPSHDSTVKNAGTQRYHFKHNFSQEPQILSVELNEDMLWWPTTESVAFKETCWWDCTVHPANWMSGTVFVPLRILLGVLIGGQICLTSTWVVIFCRFFGLPYLFFFFPSILFSHQMENCVWMAGCQQTGTVDVLMRDGDRGRPQLQPRAERDIHRQA